ncbi:hypothetical protein Pmar_PMAR020848 [Perkinsus marinus ATCC 50983]|uniref:Uncharacterized protein n=1 Tax=Perkinsus marinus (strain ATCC 50983 / TXsc) TaxID=423536 RepID=C5KN33_PERM5|nr:hypothetical protein Pmar_PMAR020848 [Perkinsus marinus ATCC 50983]EER14067.1 hypothetical protein Pmar_PMAR020848 [Perkinsus marinus ATCC 50983]|eukprot:XP_002782272.1 hypothetical protein Pmar_PMAR020848 [Perkinsus marinus ATCC 50983]
MANLGPDTWTLHTNEDNTEPVKIVATNARHGHVIHQEMRFSKFQRRDHHLAVEDARKHMYDLYRVGSGKGDLFSAASTDSGNEDYDDGFSSLRASLLSGHIPSDSMDLPEPTPWSARRQLRSSEVINFFTVEEGTAAHAYFKTVNAPRHLMTVFEFQYPTSCNDTAKKNELCLFVLADGDIFQASGSLSAGIRLPDVNKPGRVAELYLAVALAVGPDNKNIAIDLSVTARGCATIWQLGEGISITITVCLTAKGGIHYANSTLSFAASVGVSVSFDVNLPVIGSIIDFTISGEIGCTAAPNNTVTAYGKIGVSHSVLVAGASIYLDFVAATADHLPNKWQFSSGVTFSAWISLVFWRPRWTHRYVLWSVGPVTF